MGSRNTADAPTQDAIRNNGAIPIASQIASDTAEVSGDTVKDNLETLAGQMVDAVIAVADASGGATASALTVDLKKFDGTAKEEVKVVAIVASDANYAGYGDQNANVTFGTATTGSILGSGSGWAVVKTDANGQFACTASNSVDETVYFAVTSVTGGADAVASAAVVRGCIPDSATWSA